MDEKECGVVRKRSVLSAGALAAVMAVAMPHAQAVPVGGSSQGGYAEQVAPAPEVAEQAPTAEDEVSVPRLVATAPLQTMAEAIRATRGGVSGLSDLSADEIAEATKPAKGQEFVDPAYGTSIYRATDISEGDGGMMRHEYSRRQAFNADNSRYLVQDGRGFWYLYDASTFANLGRIPRRRTRPR